MNDLMNQDAEPAVAEATPSFAKHKGPSLVLAPSLHRLLLPIAGLMMLVALALLWLGWREHTAERLGAAVVQQRDQLSLDLQNYRDRAALRLNAALESQTVLDTLRAEDFDATAAAISRDWPELVAVEIHPPDLADGMQGDPAQVRYGRLALLQRALYQGRPVASVVKLDAQPVYAMAARASDDSLIRTVALIQLPLSDLQAAVAARTPPGAYLAVKQGRVLIAEHGVQSLALYAESGAVRVPDSGLRITAAAPVSGLLPLPGSGLLGLGALLLLAAGAAGVLSRRPAGAAGQAGDHPETMADALRKSPAPAPTPSVKPKSIQVPIERSIFRAYDVRGIVGKNLDANVARLLGLAIGSLMQEQGLREIVIGRDGRKSGPMLSAALAEGLRATGRDVIDIGQATTPMIYFAAFQLRTGSAVAVTGSHNPPDYNGFKIVIGGQTLYGDAIQGLYARIAEDRLHKVDTPGSLRRELVDDSYTRRIADDIQVERKLKVVVDCGNGVAGAIAPSVLEAIGCEVVPLYCEVDGGFPNHHPDPSEPENLTDLIQMVKRLDADIGLAFDGDGDRLGVVTDQGKIIYPDRLLMLFAQDVLGRNPGACIIYDVKCSGHLAGHILRHGGSPVMWKTGHSLMKAKMKETEAELAGEMSGHFFFRERWYGFDDGLYAAARLLEILAAQDDSADGVFKTLPDAVNTPELKVDIAESEQTGFIQRFQDKARFEGARIATIDGLRADWPDGWGLVRASNTTPVLVMRFEADDQAALERIQAIFREQILALMPELKLPF